MLLLPLAIGLGCDIAPVAGTAAASKRLRLIVQPDAGPAPVVALLASARNSLWLEMYLLTADAAIGAIEDRARAGCDVRVLLEPTPYRDEAGNRAAFSRLAAAGVDVRWAGGDRFRYAHAKMAVIDEARLVVMTSNLTDAGLGANREFVVVDEDPDDIAAAVALFSADRVGALAGGGGRLVTSPENTRSTFSALIEAADRTLRWQSEELVEHRIQEAFVVAAGRGVEVTVVWPGPWSSASATLAAAGVNARPVTEPASHAKAAVVDGEACYVGSANLSPTSLDANREIGLLLHDREICGAVDTAIAGDAARAGSP